MRNPLSISEFDLAGFFRCEPKALEPGIPWEYNDSVYEASDALVHLTFAIVPANRDVRIRISIGATKLFELDAMDVEDVVAYVDKGSTSLEIRLLPKQSVWLSLKPQITIRQAFCQ
jgi:hypothetical protein